MLTSRQRICNIRDCAYNERSRKFEVDFVKSSCAILIITKIWYPDAVIPISSVVQRETKDGWSLGSESFGFKSIFNRSFGSYRDTEMQSFGGWKFIRYSLALVDLEGGSYEVNNEAEPTGYMVVSYVASSSATFNDMDKTKSM